MTLGSTTTRPSPRPALDRTAGGKPAAGASAGYTIVEVLVAIILTAILGAGVVSLLMGQSRFYETNEQTLFADESRRGAGEIVASELRMLATSDLYKTDSDEIRARFDLRRMVVCKVDATLSLVWLFVYDETGISLPSGATGTAHSSPYSADFVYADGWTAGLNGTGAGTSTIVDTCNTNGAPSVSDSTRYRLVDWSGHPVGLPDKGSVVRVYGDLSYIFQPSSSGDGLALWRNGQELAAPFANGAGFVYLMDNGSKEVSVGNSNHKNIRRVGVDATATGRGTNRYDVAQDLEFDISFRN